jgi:hypothetical protein
MALTGRLFPAGGLKERMPLHPASWCSEGWR